MTSPHTGPRDPARLPSRLDLEAELQLVKRIANDACERMAILLDLIYPPQPEPVPVPVTLPRSGLRLTGPAADGFLFKGGPRA